MFSGITQAQGTVLSAETRERVRTVRIKMPRGWKLALGQSVLIDGICSTVSKNGASYFEVQYMPQTLSKTTAGSFAKGGELNLERSLTLADFVDGHFVSGHVDGRARVVSVLKAGNSRVITVELPKELRRYSAPRGSIALNGVSLTIAKKSGRTISVALIPHTLKHTNLGALKKGDAVNAEADMLARFAAASRGGRVSPNATKRIRKAARRG